MDAMRLYYHSFLYLCALIKQPARIKHTLLVFWEKGNFLHLTLASYVQATSEAD